MTGYNLARENSQVSQKAQNALDRLAIEFSHIPFNSGMSRYTISAGTAGSLTYTANFGGADEIHTINQGGDQLRLDNLPLTDLVTTNGLQFSYFNVDGNDGGWGRTDPALRIIGISLSLRGPSECYPNLQCPRSLAELSRRFTGRKDRKCGRILGMMMKKQPQRICPHLFDIYHDGPGRYGGRYLFLYHQCRLYRIDGKQPQPGLPVGPGRDELCGEELCRQGVDLNCPLVFKNKTYTLANSRGQFTYTVNVNRSNGYYDVVSIGTVNNNDGLLLARAQVASSGSRPNTKFFPGRSSR